MFEYKFFYSPFKVYSLSQGISVYSNITKQWCHLAETIRLKVSRKLTWLIRMNLWSLRYRKYFNEERVYNRMKHTFVHHMWSSMFYLRFDEIHSYRQFWGSQIVNRILRKLSKLPIKRAEACIQTDVVKSFLTQNQTTALNPFNYLDAYELL